MDVCDVSIGAHTGQLIPRAYTCTHTDALCLRSARRRHVPRGPTRASTRPTAKDTSICACVRMLPTACVRVLARGHTRAKALHTTRCAPLAWKLAL